MELPCTLGESGIATIDVEAHSPGILGKILVSFQLVSFSETDSNHNGCLAAGRNY